MGEPPDISTLSLDDQFMILLHKKIMNKTGSAKRRAKKYYVDQYKKTGIIPKPLHLAARGIMEGRKCSGRPRALSCDVKNRFIQMVKAACDADDDNFIYVTRKARTVSGFHKFLEEEFQKKISIHALYRLVRQENLHLYLKKPDFDELPAKGFFNPEDIFDLVQVDGCSFQYIKIKDENGQWRKAQVIEFYDTGSRYMFVLELYFSETSLNALDLFTRFLLCGPFPKKRIRLRPDRAKGFLNLKRPIHELNIKHSLPDGFYMQPDFTGRRSPKHKVHLESSHRSLHHFEIRIIKKFADKIAKTEQGWSFKGNRKEPIVVTCLDISLEQLRQGRMLELYRREHNESLHRFTEGGQSVKWVPSEKLAAYLSGKDTMVFDPDHVQGFIRYGFNKRKAVVSPQKTITYDKRKYTVVVGAEKFSSHKGTPVQVSHCNNKLIIFEPEKDGVFLGEALCQPPSEKPKSVVEKSEKRLKQNEVEQIAAYLQARQMSVDMKSLIACYRKGLTFNIAKAVFENNTKRYDRLVAKLHEPDRAGFVRFNAFAIDYYRYRRNQLAPAKGKAGRP